ncbi:MAG: isocitrate/isopropylmalate dehydrogenase family protein, partial [Firmicutes bacterium]|nr:isocitrate/isopropylmalate dehydrogenase family protein [Bacillota bacterium]
MTLKNREEDIKAAVKDFEKLLREQLDRADKMSSEKSSGKASDSATVIGLIDGDGIGPIIMKEARKLLEIMLSDEINAGKVILRDIKGLTIGNRKAQGKSVPDDVLDEIKSCDVLLKGPTETPKGGTMESANVTLRRELDLYANV